MWKRKFSGLYVKCNAAIVQERTYCESTRVSLTDMTEPHTWYPFARKKKRHVQLHVGPTNSGKTHNALESLRNRSGIYCSPLRLLAWEVADKLNNMNIPCSLITGQEKKEIDGAKHKSMTVEMADITCEYECAVIDEIQMVSCPRRGYAFTRALLGLAADELHLCGDPAVVPLVQRIIASTGDTLHVLCYTRLSPLLPLPTPLRVITEVEAGDCLVAFSRKDLYQIKEVVENLRSNHKCAMIYGSLPPEARARQAEQFNDTNCDVDVLVASDAVGMGLNLNIHRVVFMSLDKYDGIGFRPLEIMQTKQIAGRAGRYNSIYPSGEVTSLKGRDLPRLHKTLATATPTVKAAGLFPTYEHLSLYAALHPSLPFVAIVARFMERATLSGLYFLCDCRPMLEIAKLIADIRMPLESRYLFCTCPADTDNKVVMGALVEFARNYGSDRHVPLKKLLTPDTIMVPRSQRDIAELECLNKVLDMYIWLSFRMKKEFPDYAIAMSQKTICNDLIEEALNALGPVAVRRDHQKHDFIKKLMRCSFLSSDTKIKVNRGTWLQLGRPVNYDSRVD